MSPSKNFPAHQSLNPWPRGCESTLTRFVTVARCWRWEMPNNTDTTLKLPSRSDSKPQQRRSAKNLLTFFCRFLHDSHGRTVKPQVRRKPAPSHFFARVHSGNEAAATRWRRQYLANICLDSNVIRFLCERGGPSPSTGLLWLTRLYLFFAIDTLDWLVFVRARGRERETKWICTTRGSNSRGCNVPTDPERISIWQAQRGSSLVFGVAN